MARHRIMAVGVSLVLACGLALAPTAARADTVEELQAQLDEASAKLEELGRKVVEAGEYLQEIQYNLDETKRSIKDTEGKIDEKQAELAEDQRALSDQVVDQYKNGSLSLIEILLNSTTVEDFVSNVYYLNKVEEKSVETIAEVNRVKAELDQEKAELTSLEAEQQDLVDQQQAQVTVLEEQQAEQQAYVDGLSSEVQEALEARRQAELEAQRKAAEEAQRQAELEAQQSQGSGGENPNHNNGQPAPSVGGSSGGLSASQRQAILDAAYSQIGVPYSYGACSPGVAFDCSGFTSWCYAQAGISIPHSASAQGAGMTRIDPANAQPGDLMIWLGGMNPMSGNHASIYLGGNQMINADWQGVVIETIWQRGPDLWGYYS